MSLAINGSVCPTVQREGETIIEETCVNSARPSFSVSPDVPCVPAAQNLAINNKNNSYDNNTNNNNNKCK